MDLSLLVHAYGKVKIWVRNSNLQLWYDHVCSGVRFTRHYYIIIQKEICHNINLFVGI